jgi:hypothetical protein
MPDDVRSAQDVFEDHLRQGQSGSIEADLARNYAEDALVLPGRGVFRGHDGLRELQKLLSERRRRRASRTRRNCSRARPAFSSGPPNPTRR